MISISIDLETKPVMKIIDKISDLMITTENSMTITHKVSNRLLKMTNDLVMSMANKKPNALLTTMTTKASLAMRMSDKRMRTFSTSDGMMENPAISDWLETNTLLTNILQTGKMANGSYKMDNTMAYSTIIWVEVLTMASFATNS